jgi:membrane-associated phospholipid phosphatase
MERPAHSIDEPREPNPATFRVWPAWRWLAGVVVLTVGLMLIDAPIRPMFRPIEIWVEEESDFWSFFKQFGEWWLVLSVAGLLGVFHAWRWRAVVPLLMGIGLAQLTTSVLMWSTGRPRPTLMDRGPWDWEPFRGGPAGLFELQNLSMPSGHASTAFAMAMTLALLVPRGAGLWFVIASLTAVERVISLAHWASDVVVSALVGVVCARAALWLCYVLTGQRAVTRRHAASGPSVRVETSTS